MKIGSARASRSMALEHPPACFAPLRLPQPPLYLDASVHSTTIVLIFHLIEAGRGPGRVRDAAFGPRATPSGRRGGRLLLRQAMERAQAEDEVDGVDADDLAV